MQSATLLPSRFWLLALVLAGLAPAGTDPDRRVPHRTVFFAVLEGLYEDGVATEDVERILLEDEAERLIHFVPGCPLCMPARDAFRVYRTRALWTDYKDLPEGTFGPGLDKETRAALHSGDFATRFQAIQRLIERWVGKRLDLMRLTKDERFAWRNAIADMRKRGTALLQSANAALRSQKSCAVCEGAYAPLADE